MPDQRRIFQRWRRSFDRLQGLSVEAATSPLPPAEALRAGLELIALAEALALPEPEATAARREAAEQEVRDRWARIRRALS